MGREWNCGVVLVVGGGLRLPSERSGIRGRKEDARENDKLKQRNIADANI